MVEGGQGPPGVEPMLILQQVPVWGHKGLDQKNASVGRLTVSKTPSENVSYVFSWEMPPTEQLSEAVRDRRWALGFPDGFLIREVLNSIVSVPANSQGFLELLEAMDPLQTGQQVKGTFQSKPPETAGQMPWKLYGLLSSLYGGKESREHNSDEFPLCPTHLVSSLSLHYLNIIT